MKALGKLREREHLQDWWISAPLPVALFVDRPVPFVVHASVLAEVPEAADLAVNAFRGIVDTEARLADAVFAYYERCVRLNAPRRFRSASELWSTLRPDSVTIERDPRTGFIHLLVNTECEWDEEHGLQLVFRLGTDLVRVGQQDGRLVDRPEGKDPFQVE